MVPQVVLVDVDPRIVVAWQATFEDCPEVEIVQGSMLDQHVDAWVTPTNARGNMDGGLDARIRSHLGERIQQRVHAAIRREHGGVMKVGQATCVKTGRIGQSGQAGRAHGQSPVYLISTPTMTSSADDVSETLNVALACAAAFHAARVASKIAGQLPLNSMAISGLGASTGKVSPETCATLMWVAYQLCRTRDFASFAELRAALEAEIGDLDHTTTTPQKPRPRAKGWQRWLGWLGDLLGLDA